MNVFALILGVLTLATPHDEIGDSATVGDILNLGAYNATNAANWAISRYDSTNLSGRISAKYTKPQSGIPMTDLKTDLQQTIYGKQDALVSGTNIKTINNQSILGAGNLVIQGGGGTSDYTLLTNKPKISNVTLNGNVSLAAIGAQPKLADYTTTNAVKAIINAEVGGTNTLVHSDAIADMATKAWTRGEGYAKTNAEGKVTALETDPTATAKAQAAIAAAGCVTTNEYGEINVDGDIYTIKDVFARGLYVRAEGSSSSICYGYDYITGNYNNWIGPWSSFYGNDPTHDLALRSQITNVTDSTVSGWGYTKNAIPVKGGTNSVDTLLAAARTDSETISATAIANANTTYTPTSGLVSLNQSVQYVEGNGGVLTIDAPTSVANGTRDWIVYVNATADTALNLAALPHIFVADAAYTNACASDKVTMLCFTEMTNNVFVIGRQELTAVK